MSSQYFAIKNGVDCEQPLFFFRVSEESAYDARVENRVWSFVCLVRFTQRTNKKKDCSKESEEWHIRKVSKKRQVVSGGFCQLPALSVNPGCTGGLYK